MAKPNTGLALLCFTQKQVFGPRVAKSPAIWIKFCTHLLLYGIHLWAKLHRDRRMGGFRPNQDDYVFVILVTHPKSYIVTKGSPRFQRQNGGEDGCYHEKFRNFVALVEPDPKQHFFAF